MTPAFAEHPTRPSNAGAGVRDTLSVPRPPACPRCKSSVMRIPRRFIDRFISVFHPVHRYRCHSIVCNWEGNLACTLPVRDGRESTE